ncbi:TonB-dependent siderophore receptor [Herminiimonas glaciei]|uniref:TonB-dependent siderophore receptor n=1 Tax=Herminiimonas glaciei TaxID=523788 RepID=A0ABW2IC95_9BURK
MSLSSPLNGPTRACALPQHTLLVKTIQALFVALPLFALLPAVPALAQTSVGNAAAVRSYEIPAGQLSSALSRFAAEAGVQLSVDAAVTANLHSPGLKGRHTVASGFSALLAGTGLEAAPRGNGEYTLRKAPGVMESTLPVVEVSSTAANENAAGITGYVARRSRTANKTNSSLVETPQSISVITQENLVDRQVQSVSEALLYSANVNGQRYGADTRSDYFTIRGFNSDLYLDGLRVPQIASQTGGYAGFLIEPFSLDRVEVLRGPSSALFGQSNVGGIVNMVSKDPQATPSGEVYARVGSYDRKEIGFDMTGPINNDPRLTYRVNGIVRDADTSYAFGKNDRIAINPSIAWRPDANTSLIVSAGYMKDDIGQAGVIVPATGSVLPNKLGLTIPSNFSDGDPRNAIYKKEISYIGYRFEHTFNDTFTLRNNLRYSKLKTDYRNLYTSGLAADERTISRANYNAQPELDALAIDTQLESRFNTGVARHTLLAGLDLQWQKLVNNTGNAAGPTQDLFNPIYTKPLVPTAFIDRSEQEQYQTGIYIQDQVKLGKLNVLAALRKDFVRVTTDNTKLATGVVTPFKQDPEKTTGKIGASYLFDSGFAPYALYSTSFLPTLTTNATPLKPTTGTLKEVGLKYAPLDKDYSVTLSAFEATQQNVVNRVSGVIYQTDEVQVRGIELEAVASLSKRLNVTAALSVQDPEVTKSVTPAQVGKLPYTVPKTQQSLFASYKLSLPQDMRGELTIGGGARRIGKTAGDTANTFFVPSYTLVDAFLRYDIDKYSFQINGYNLGDKTYVAGCNAMIQCYYGQGRTVVATVRMHW